jgi:hypothetical protein
MFNLRSMSLRAIAIRLACLSIGIVMIATTAVALARQTEELPPVSIERTPQSAIDEAFAILRAHSIDITRTERPPVDSCSNFHTSFLNPGCSKTHKKKAARVRRVATFAVGRLNPSE